jgi:hypothetical protein
MRLLIAAVYVWIIYRLAKHILRREPAQEEPEDDADYRLLTIREQAEAARIMADTIGDVEDLITDLQTCSGEYLVNIRISWVGSTGAHHVDIMCDGINTASCCMEQIMEREIHDRKVALSRQCRALARGTRSVPISGQNGTR